ncbi:MAG: primosomal replication protein N [Burkholderiales bacterium]
MDERNQVTLSGEVIGKDTLRTTPAGIPIIEFRLKHNSQQLEAGMQRVVQCEVAVMALGEVARELGNISNGEQIAVQGFLASRNRLSDYPVLHVNKFRKTNEV